MAKYRPEDSRKPVAPARDTIRLDKWLWQARFFRSRPMACEMIAEGHLRLNGQRCLKPGHQVGEGDTLTFPQGGRIRLIRVLAPGQRRGPATEAQTLYRDLDPQSNPDPADLSEQDTDEAADFRNDFPE
ncbi:RNA-binding S4 domain-containing protein [Gemmobacter denitrificans]|uniref:RNA-binding S4 domain-containing protein n=1 Tax=Gemmobacter denitrificans TaxID=3123040 RepID=A0ABU8BTE5_9RHOB